MPPLVLQRPRKQKGAFTKHPARARATARAKKNATNTQTPRRRPQGAKTLPQPVKKPHRYKPSTLALREIRRYQTQQGLMIPEHPFKRLCKEILDDVAKDVAKGGMVEYRMARSAVYALQEAAEDHLVLNFEMTNLAALHARRVTIMKKDMDLVRKLRALATGGLRTR